MKTVGPQVIMFYYTLFGFGASAVYIFSEMAFMEQPQSRLEIYTTRQYLIALGVSAFDIGGFTGNIVAYQADKSGFVALISYMGVVYSYLCDQFILDEQLSMLELICTVSILAVAVSTAFYKFRKQ